MRIYLSIALALAACSLPALGSSCTNPCTGSLSTGQDTTDRNNFVSDNSSLTFSNITFSSGTWTTGTGGAILDSGTGLTFIGCLTSFSDCSSNSGGVTVGNSGSFWNGSTFGSWNGGNDPILSGPAPNGPGQWSTITISLPANVFAIGLDILQNNYGSSSTPFGVIVNGGSQYNTATQVQLPGSVFFGFSSTTAITSLTIFPENGSTTLGIDNIDVGSLTSGGTSGSGGGGSAPSTTPEASTMLLVGSGFFMLRFARKLPCFSR